MFVFRLVASNSHNAVGLKSRRNTKQLMLLRISINLKTPRKCGVLNFYGEGGRNNTDGNAPIFAPILRAFTPRFYMLNIIHFSHSILLFLPLFQPCTGRKYPTTRLYTSHFVPWQLACASFSSAISFSSSAFVFINYPVFAFFTHQPAWLATLAANALTKISVKLCIRAFHK